MEIETLDPKEYIIIKGAKENNLKNIDVAVKRNTLTVITGVSGSGKSSLAFDTLYAEGQRMYVESLSSYARQFLGRMEKPAVEYIKGVSPAIAIEQKVTTKNPRSTVGTSTEIYDYLKLLYARVGITYSPVSGKEVKKHSVSDVVDYIISLPEGSKVLLLSLLKVHPERTLKKELELLLKKGFTRIMVDNEMMQVEDAEATKLKGKAIYIIIDRVVSKKDDEELVFRLSDSVQTALFEGEDECQVFDYTTNVLKTFSDKFEMDGMTFEIPTVNFFSFNNPFGACKKCEGFGHILGIDPDLVIPDKNLSLFEGAVAPWRGEKLKAWAEPIIKNGIKFDFPIHRPYKDLDQKDKDLLWTGNKYFDGLNEFFKHLESQLHKIQYRVLLSRYRGRTICPDCKGTRVRQDANYVKVNGKSIIELLLVPVDQLLIWFQNIELNEYQEKVASRLLKEITNRLGFLTQVGLGYLTLNRLSSTLSGGEHQRIKLATHLGSALVGSMYILDEPSIGLHPRDTEQLIGVLKHLRDLGNTVIVVEHEEEVMRAADELIDIGPEAGRLGGELIYQGKLADIGGNERSLTNRYLNGDLEVSVPKNRRKWQHFLEFKGASENNLKNVDVTIPLHTLTVITGVSGSGKSTLVKKIIYPAVKKHFGEHSDFTGKFTEMSGNIEAIEEIELVDQNPIGKSSRSNPITYIKGYDFIRQLYADQPLSQQRGFKPSMFSFNVEGGRCDNCQGEGTVKIEMQFMADLHLTCEVCKGKRFKQEVLDVEYSGKNISEVLDLTIEDAIDFFSKHPKILEKLEPLRQVGLGYVSLGQSSNSLSGGEAQRVKLASFLSKGRSEAPKLFIFDEPTTGLHFNDIAKLLKSMNALIDNGHSVLVIEHNMDVIKCADWVIDLGPEGGDRGGEICFAGTPEELAKVKDNHTAKFLKGKL